MLFDKLNLSLAEAVKDVQSTKKEGNAFSKALMAAKEKGDKTFTVAGKEYDVQTEQEVDPDDKKAAKKVEEKTDPVNPKAAAKDFKDRKDKDIDNDGDVDDSDEYLHKRRKAGTKDVDEGMSDKKAVAAMKAMLDGMSKKDAIAKFGVSPKKLDALRKNLFKEEIELEEASNWGKASNALRSYAKKSGGIDQKDMMRVADQIDAVGKADLMKKSSKLAQMSKTIYSLDTDVREKIFGILKANGLMEQIEEAVTQKAKEGPDAAEQEKLEPRAKGEKDFADKHDVEEPKDEEKEHEQDTKAMTKDVKKAPENKAKSVREALMDIWGK